MFDSLQVVVIHAVYHPFEFFVVCGAKAIFPHGLVGGKDVLYFIVQIRDDGLFAVEVQRLRRLVQVGILDCVVDKIGGFFARADERIDADERAVGVSQEFRIDPKRKNGILAERKVAGKRLVIAVGGPLEVAVADANSAWLIQ